MSDAKPTIVFLSTYPPRECGLATFTQDLLHASQNFPGPLIDCRVAALNLSPLDTYKYPPEVEWKIDQNSQTDLQNLAEIINRDNNISGIIIQHEYGIFGGLEGEKLLTFMRFCQKPILVTLHTVLPKPSLKMKTVTNSIIKLAHTLVVLTHGSQKIIESLYPESIGKTFMIPHGIHPVSFSGSKKYQAKLKLDQHLILSTFGLLNRGKGIEYVLRALPQVIKQYPRVLYLILGETHPVIRRQEGEKYRFELAKLITQLGLKQHVRFYDQYFSLKDLFEFLKATDIYISPSTNPNQAVSGTLSYALGTGRTVISTEFAQAKEIVTPQTGRLIPVKNSPAITSALLDLLSNEKRLMQMHHHAYAITRSMLWNKVAGEYLALLARMIVPKLKTDHLLAMTDNFGLFQFATLSIPNKNFGYTLDDNARAAIICSWLKLKSLIPVYLHFIQQCQQPNGSFINYFDYDTKKPTPQNDREDLEDTQARALWALSEIMADQNLAISLCRQAKTIFLKNLRLKTKLSHLRAQALAIKAFALASPLLPEKSAELLSQIKTYADSLVSRLTANSNQSWHWFESNLNYNNALLSESLLIAGKILNHDRYTRKGLLSLEFLISQNFTPAYIPTKSGFDQQPEDPAAMILALVRAYNYTGQAKYKKLANQCFTWFLGNNSLQQSLYDPQTGGCYDGLHPDRINLNQGAESLVSYLMSSYLIKTLNQ